MAAASSLPRPNDCYACDHFISDPDDLERALPGLTILSSAWGSTRGRAGLCQCHDTWQDPERNCSDFRASNAATFPSGAVRVTGR